VNTEPRHNDCADTPQPDSSEDSRQTPPPERPFSVAGMDLPWATVLCWGGRPPVDGLAGFHLYRVDKTPDGPEWVRLSDELLPLEGMFHDTDHHSLAGFSGDPFDVLIGPSDDPQRAGAGTGPLGGDGEASPDVGGGPDPLGPADPGWLRDWVELLGTFPNNPFALDAEPGSAPIAADTYCLVGEYLTGERDGVQRPAGKNRDWTPADRGLRDRMIQWALREIRRRGLVAKLRPNPQNLTYAQLMGVVTVTGDCGQIGADKVGQTAPAGRVRPGGRRLKSSIVINGAWAIDYPPDDTWVAILLHEMAHALQNYEGLPAWAPGTLIGAATFSVQSEIGAYESIWDRIAAGDLRLNNRQKCAEISAAIAAIMKEIHALAGEFTKAGAAPTPADRARFTNLRRLGRSLLLKYQTFLAGLPAGVAGWQYRHTSGARENLKDVVDRLLDQVFRGP